MDDRFRGDLHRCSDEALGNEVGECVTTDRTEREHFRTVVERRIGIGEYLAQQVLTTTEKDVGDIRLELEDAPYARGQRWIQRHDLLELVEHEHRPSIPAARNLLRQFK